MPGDIVRIGDTRVAKVDSSLELTDASLTDAAPRESGILIGVTQNFGCKKFDCKKCSA
jgi:hypothetical protein